MTARHPTFYAKRGRDGTVHIGLDCILDGFHGGSVSRRQLEEILMGALTTNWGILKAAKAVEDQKIVDLTNQVVALQAQVPDAADVATIAEIAAAAAAAAPAPVAQPADPSPPVAGA